ncbi:MAG: hypothetical protein C0518_03965 [Opitutus sp.]|nr:hypothetical protein [Opitutus sp.]
MQKTKIAGLIAGMFGIVAVFALAPRERARTAGAQPAEAAPTRSDVAAVSVLGNARTTELTRTVRARFATLPETDVTRTATDIFPGAAELLTSWHASHPREVTVAPYPDLPLKFTQTKLTRDGDIATWVGRDPELPGATLVGVARPGGYDAVLLVPGASQFFIHVREGLVRIEESVASGADCGVGDLPMRSVAAREPAVHYAEAGDAAVNALDVTESIHAVTAPLYSDVLFLYNAHALTVAQQRSTDPIGYIDGYSRASLETCSQALVNSRIDAFAWRYLGLASAPSYPAKTTVGQEVEVLAPDGPLYSFVQDIRRGYGADQVLMWLGTGDRKGAAYTGGRGNPAPLEGAVAVLRITAPVLVLAHELGHNFGCHHDRAHAGSGGGDQPQPDGDGFWCYGLLWNDPVSEGTTTSGTIMAYADWVVPYYTNPAITLDVTSTMQGRPGAPRSLGMRTIGFAESDPRAANNVRVLLDGAPTIIAHGVEDERAPAIWDHPQNASLVAGASMSLSVAASGRNLAYQWSRNGTAIAGATSSVLARTFAAADAGDYTVAVTNSRGTATSRAATVSATAAPAPTTPSLPTPSNSGAGGGGGGGSPSWFFLATVAALAALRRKCRPN